MKRLIEAFIKSAENEMAWVSGPPKEWVDLARYQELRDSVRKIASNSFSTIELQAMREEAMCAYDEMKTAFQTKDRIKKALQAAFPESELLEMNYNEEAAQEKLEMLEKYLTKLCATLAAIEIAETTGLIKPL